jgi:hypothetical protein
MKAAEDALGVYIQDKSQREAKIEKKRENLKKLEDITAIQDNGLKESDVEKNAALTFAKTLSFNRIDLEAREASREEDPTQSSDAHVIPSEPTEEDIDAVEIIEVDHNSKYFDSKVETTKKKLEKEKARREVSGDDPQQAFDRYERARTMLKGKRQEKEEINILVDEQTEDIKNRKQRWEQMREGISRNTSIKFDEILNIKGSSGCLEFDHGDGKLGLTVQKDSSDSNSQQKDVKALR